MLLCTFTPYGGHVLGSKYNLASLVFLDIRKDMPIMSCLELKIAYHLICISDRYEPFYFIVPQALCKRLPP